MFDIADEEYDGDSEGAHIEWQALLRETPPK